MKEYIKEMDGKECEIDIDQLSSTAEIPASQMSGFDRVSMKDLKQYVKLELLSGLLEEISEYATLKTTKCKKTGEYKFKVTLNLMK